VCTCTVTRCSRCWRWSLRSVSWRRALRVRSVYRALTSALQTRSVKTSASLPTRSVLTSPISSTVYVMCNAFRAIGNNMFTNVFCVSIEEKSIKFSLRQYRLLFSTMAASELLRCTSVQLFLYI